MTTASRSARLMLLVSALASLVSASPLGSVYIQDAAQCPANFQSCPSGLPNNFCCAEGTSCLPLAGNTTALCCPNGSTCEKIQPITCDVNQQDPSKNQNSPIKTSIFDVALAKCGTDLCCPFGYSCSEDNTQCVKNADQSTSPESASSSSSPSQTTASQTSTSPASATSATTAPTSAQASSTPASSLVVAPIATTPTSFPTEESTLPSTTLPSTTLPSTTLPSTTSIPDPSPTADKSSGPESTPSKATNPKTVSIIGGVIGGCAVLAVLGAIVFLFIRRRNRRSKNGYSEKTGFGRIKHLGPGPQGTSIMVSDPILQPNSYRADFIRKSPSISSSISQMPPQIVLNHNDTSRRLSIPNPFDSPSPSNHSPTGSQGSISSDDERNARTGHVESRNRLAPIRAMKASSTRVYPQNVPGEPSGENINIFADPIMMHSTYDRRQTHATTFTDLMVEAQLEDVHRGEPYLGPPAMMNRI
ncbi:uncharacterized protein Triagg1_3001 [Trichoderma aggressivum f. europaeum]|uniref:Mid2 domain-containing protein n=1 Tax=Trichoderma aggressivum f. europaeum TaxID=173218 RepID=A0AAE1IGZ7_9HYPO|nr:hypothetical protein Triagg1_3001 [Trichoderma aggressivum f. europaeum]